MVVSGSAVGSATLSVSLLSVLLSTFLPFFLFIRPYMASVEIYCLQVVTRVSLCCREQKSACLSMINKLISIYSTVQLSINIPLVNKYGLTLLFRLLKVLMCFLLVLFKLKIRRIKLKPMLCIEQA